MNSTRRAPRVCFFDMVQGARVTARGLPLLSNHAGRAGDRVSRIQSRDRIGGARAPKGRWRSSGGFLLRVRGHVERAWQPFRDEPLRGLLGRREQQAHNRERHPRDAEQHSSPRRQLIEAAPQRVGAWRRLGLHRRGVQRSCAQQRRRGVGVGLLRRVDRAASARSSPLLLACVPAGVPPRVKMGATCHAVSRGVSLARPHGRHESCPAASREQ